VGGIGSGFARSDSLMMFVSMPFRLFQLIYRSSEIMIFREGDLLDYINCHVSVDTTEMIRRPQSVIR
jgi:hypothetical protein